MQKVAILFGINNYLQCSLKNATNDAVALSDKLRELGFATKCFLNVDAMTMDRELIAFKSDLEDASVGLFFFAGHGIQCKGENFLATIDTSFADEISCKHTAIPLNEVIEIFEDSKIGTKVLILDACRNNPFVAWRSAANDGLAPVYAPKGTIIAFSTSPGQKASDGNNNHGVYTNALLMHISTKNLSIEDMFKRVRNTVSSHTNHQQITWEHTSLMGTYCFNTGYDEGEIRTAYSDNALADRNYIFDNDDDIQMIVDKLKSYNWYTQNPAIKLLQRLDFSRADKDDLFILGRNIYQTACGSAGNAISWIDNIESHLGYIGGNAALHILNGILFEIYFDSDGHLRKTLKAEYYEKPVRLCQKDKYSPCGAFIRSFLEQYQQRIIYVPSSKETLNIDITLKKYEQYHIEGVFIDGLACMYDEDGLKLYEYDDSYYSVRELTPSQLEYQIAEMIATPRNKIKITFSERLDPEDKILVPYQFQLLRYVQ